MEICEKIQNYIFYLKYIDNKLDDHLLYDIKKIRYYIDKSNSNLALFKYEERIINWLASYLKICRSIEK
tara:strand:+ start:69 stop:275 length:207 start_codon:yes stop_codon:yes gene_type:complete